MTLYLIRHGETEGAEAKRYKGHMDVPLSPRGEEQMEKAALMIKRPLKAVYTSDLIRAVRSAGIIAGPLTPVIVPAFRERDFGAWEGMSWDEIKDKYPDAFSSWAKDPVRFSPPRGESTLELKERVMAALDEMLARHNDGESIAVVAHGGVNRVVLCTLLGIPLENIFRVEQDWACLNIIEFWGEMPVVKLLNGVPW